MKAATAAIAGGEGVPEFGPDDWVLVLRVEGDDATAISRLRLALKRMLRVLRIRCVAIGSTKMLRDGQPAGQARSRQLPSRQGGSGASSGCQDAAEA
jgi:hypothetical protein